MAEKNFTIYKSSAGSGKTFTLVREYLGVVLREPDHYRHVLAITFTNKAAGEMKARIISELRTLATGEASAMLQLVREDTQLPATTLIENARQVLSRILHDYGNFAVSTIDSFTYRLIRNFARDLDLPSKFDVETDTQALLERMVDQLLDTIGRDPFITQILVHFAEEKLRDEAGWHIERDIGEVARELFKESSKAPIQSLHQMEPKEVMDFIEFIQQQRDNYPARIAELAGEAVQLIQASGLGPADFFGGARSSCVNAFWKLQKKISPRDYQKLIETGRFRSAWEDGKWYSKKTNAAAIDTLLEKGLQAATDALVAFHQEHFDGYVTAFHAYQNIHSLAVLRQIEELLDVYKSQNNLVHISDFQDKISDFIQGEAPDYIYWRLGERFRHYLLDEFQDTSVLQWLNLVPLFEYVRTDTDRDGSLLLVGDSKQAIYRWRGGEVDLLETIAPHALDVEPRLLDTNFRSLEFVVDFNNRFFTKVRDILQANAPVRGIYDQFAQKVRSGHKAAGLVQVALLEGKKKDDYQENALSKLVGQITEMLNQGFELRDMAILVRTGREGSVIAQYLNEHHIRVISSDSILLAKSPVVSFIISLFKFLVDPRDRIAQAELVTYYFAYLEAGKEDNDSGIDPLFQDHDPQQKVREILQKEGTISEIFSELPPAFRTLSYQLDRLPLYELAEQVIQIFELKHISPAFLQHFLDVVLEYSERKKPDLVGFLQYWEEQKGKFSVVIPEGENAVEIITIHKSKGLEYPVVFVPFCNWEIQPRFNHAFWASSEGGFGDYPDTYLVQPRKELVESHFRQDYELELDRTLLDNVNLLYVAFTRPRERLYIYAPIWNRRESTPPTLRDIRTAGHLINMVLEDDDFAGLDDELYETGLPLPPQEQRSAGNSVVAEELLSGPWRDRIRIDRKFRKYWDSGEAGESQRHRDIPDGTIMAETLRRMGESEELALLLNDLQEEGLIEEKRRWDIEEKMDRLLQRPPLKAWFQNTRFLRRSAEILSPQGESLAPDRLMVRDEIATFVDFHDLEREKPDRKKMRAYAKMLTAMGYSDVRGFICSLPGGKVTPL